MPPIPSDLKSRWEIGLRLADAAFDYASDHEKQGYRYAMGGSGSQARLILMTAGLFDKIYAEELLAVGIRVSNERVPELEIIPSLFFNETDQTTICRALESEDSTLKFAGREWHQVRIIENVGTVKAIAIATRSPGRPTVGPVLQKVVAALEGEGLLAGITRKEQENAVRERAFILIYFRSRVSPHARRFWKHFAISMRGLR